MWVTRSVVFKAVICFVTIALLTESSLACAVVRYQEPDRWDHISWGVVIKNVGNKQSVIPIQHSTIYKTTKEFLQNGGREKALEICSYFSNGQQQQTKVFELVNLSDVKLISPVTSEGISMICQGLNFQEHQNEIDVKTASNVIFYKAPSSISPPSGVLKRPPHVRLLDYEVELGVVFRKDLTKPTRFTRLSELHEYIGGIVVVNDFSARDIQLPENQWSKGKSFRGFGPTGPYLKLLSAEELEKYINNLTLKLWVNGQLRQKASTKQMINKVLDTVSELSFVQDIKAGDMLVTGTPSGVAASAPPALISSVMQILLDKESIWGLFVDTQSWSSRYLQDGDIVTATIISDDGLIDLGMQRIEIQTDNNKQWREFDSFIVKRDYLIPLVVSCSVWLVLIVLLIFVVYQCGKRRLFPSLTQKKSKTH